MTKTPTVTAYTDGACLGNPGPGGWAYRIHVDQNTYDQAGSCADTTNNRMELEAVIQALKSLAHPTHLTLYTDSQYVRQGITTWIHTWQANGWRTAQKKPVKNQDLWEILLRQQTHHKINWQWIKAHSGHPDNEHVDKMARQQAISIKT